jgi:hypothetical protein
MRSIVACLVVSGVVVAAATASAQTAPSSAAATDIYHVHFTKATPGQAAALGKVLTTPDKSSPMPEHFVVLRHQEGDDWDYAVIQHLGPKAEVSAAAPAAPAAERNMRAWHTDTFVSGPSWADFTRQMGVGGSGSAPGLVYIVGVHRPVPAHREQLEKALNAPAPSSKVETGNVFLQHVEGADWTFLTITRYNSWQDLASERAAAVSAGPSTAGGWADVREHSAFHRDTIADRIYPAK